MLTLRERLPPAFGHVVGLWPILVPTVVGAIIRLGCHTRTPLLVALDSVLYYLFALDWKRNLEWRALLPFRTPVYPMVLGEGMRLLGESPVSVTIVHAALGLVTVALVSDIARRLLGPRLGLLAGLVCAIYPTLIFFENFLLTETLAACLTVAFMWSLLQYESSQNANWMRAAGILGALAALTRPTLAGLLLAPVAAVLWRRARQGLPGLARSLPLYAAYGAMLVVPWVLYVAARSGTASLTVATGWQLWIYQHLDRSFDDAVPSFSPYRDRYREYLAAAPGQDSGWMLRKDLEQEYEHQLAAIDRAFLRFALESIAAHPARYAGRVAYSAAYFLGLVPVDDREVNEADWLIRRTLGDRQFRLEIGIEYMTATGYFLPADPRAALVNPCDCWLLDLYLIFRQRGFVLTPLFVAGLINLWRWRRYPFYGMSLFAAVAGVALLHSLFLANLDRYHWVMEPAMLTAAAGIGYRPTAAEGT